MTSEVLDVLTMRRQARSVLLVTGASGFVGSHIVAELLRKGFKVKALCRGRDRISATERLRRVMLWHGIELDERVEVIEGDLRKPQLGLSPGEFAALGRSITEIVHCASSTSFAEKNRRQIESINIGGTKCCLELAQVGTVKHIHHISTAYAAGITGQPCREELVLPARFHNPYESSKNQAEHLVANQCDELGIGWTIYRPSVIIGDSGTGRTFLFNGMYYVVRYFDHMQRIVRHRYLKQGADVTDKPGVEITSGGTVVLPIRMNRGTPAGGMINIVPIDYVIQAFMAIYFSDACHGVFNLVNDSGLSLETVMFYIEQYYKIQGIRPLPTEVYESTPVTQLQQEFTSFAEMYLPYMADDRRFVCERVRPLLASWGVTCPRVTYGVFEKCIDYAVRSRWRPDLCAAAVEVPQTDDQSQSDVVCSPTASPAVDCEALP